VAQLHDDDDDDDEKEGEGFDYVRQNFPLICEPKIKEGIFVGSQVKQLFQDSRILR